MSTCSGWFEFKNTVLEFAATPLLVQSDPTLSYSFEGLYSILVEGYQHQDSCEQGWGIRMYGSYTAVSTPFLTLFPPFFRLFFALSGFLAPRRRERAKDGGKWAKNGRNRGAETPEIIRIPHPC